MAPRRDWTILEKKHDAESRAAHTSVFTISNGYMALKGDLLEERGDRFPTTFINGLFDVADMIGQVPVTKHERRYLDENYFDGAGPSPSIANLPNPLAVRVFIGDDELVFERGAITAFKRTYELDTGLYSYEYVHADANGRRTHVSMHRACDMEVVHNASMCYTVTPLNYGGTIRIMSGIDGAIRSNMTGGRQVDVLSTKASRDKKTILLEARTAHTDVGVKLAAFHDFNRRPTTAPTVLAAADSIWTCHEFRARRNGRIMLRKLIVLASSLDDDQKAYADPAKFARPDIWTAGVEDYNLAWWTNTWKRLDVRIDGDPVAQLRLRFCLFHLMCAAPRHADAMSIPCKLLTGEHYQGTTFYDTDLYVEPVFTFTFPDVARRMLAYRCVGLGPARVIAKDLGYRGAKLAWQSGPNAIEALGKWYVFTRTNIHINADVAYSLMLYLDATGDWDFMRRCGAELLVETARFYHARARRNEDGSFSYADVSGPDEGHCESTDNYYTNLMARRHLFAACGVLDRLKRDHPKDHARLVKRLKLDEDELAEWHRVAVHLRFLFDPKTNVFEQYDGFDALEPAPADLLEGRTQWFATVAPYQALNQPDVVMAHVLCREAIPRDVMRANWAYYRDKSMNFSSMSFVVNSIMAAMMGELDDAYRDFMISAGMDLDPALTGRGDTPDGLHGTAMGGAWMAAVFGFGGITLADGMLHVEPRLPAHWKSLAFTLRIHGEDLAFTITHDAVSISAPKKSPIELPAAVYGRSTVIRGGRTLVEKTA